MGFMKSITNLFKPDDEYVDDSEYTEEEYEEEAPARESRPARPAGSASSNASLEMKIIKPERYEDVTGIAQHLLHRRTVVLNLENTNKETIRRIIDFLSGVAFAIGGNLNRVANSTYVITPKNVELSDDQKETSAEEKNVNNAPRELF
ncbi:MAG: cell division protein SepF [Ruminococcaceae bacterium]|nr:cell division protein SepF [Oscillospiraceae bacterium]MBR2914649.1 cell division protein SepF [Clostridia bacterium]